MVNWKLCLQILHLSYNNNNIINNNNKKIETFFDVILTIHQKINYNNCKSSSNQTKSTKIKWETVSLMNKRAVNKNTWKAHSYTTEL